MKESKIKKMFYRLFLFSTVFVFWELFFTVIFKLLEGKGIWWQIGKLKEIGKQ